MERIVVIGGVAAGTSAAARARRCCPDAAITIYERGDFVSYAGCGTPYFIGGVVTDRDSLIARTPEEFRRLNNIEVLTGHEVTEIDAAGSRVRVRNREGAESWAPYTALLVATGAAAFVPPVQGTGLEGVFTIRSLTDALEIVSFIGRERPRKAVVVGAGPVGLEMCEAFVTLGMEVTLIELSEQIMPSLDAEPAGAVLATLERHGVTCMPGTGLVGLEGNGSLSRVTTGSGSLEADIAILGIGIRPVSNLALAAGMELGTGGAIRVDSRLSTGLENVYAAGDCATTVNTVTGAEAWMPLGSTARKQGRAAGEIMTGAPTVFPGVQGTSIVKCFDLTIGRTGLSGLEAASAGFDYVATSIEARSLPGYYPGGGSLQIKLSADRGTGVLLGAQVVGDTASGADRRLDVFAMAVRDRLTADELQYLDLAYAPPYSTALDAALVAGNVLAADVYGRACGCTPEGLE